MITFQRNAVQVFYEPAGNRDPFGSDFCVEKRIKIIQRNRTINLVMTVVKFFDGLLNFIMFISDFAYQFFQYIFHGNNSQRAAVFINDDGDMRFLNLKHLQDIAAFNILTDIKMGDSVYKNVNCSFIYDDEIETSLIF